MSLNLYCTSENADKFFINWPGRKKKDFVHYIFKRKIVIFDIERSRTFQMTSKKPKETVHLKNEKNSNNVVGCKLINLYYINTNKYTKFSSCKIRQSCDKRVNYLKEKWHIAFNNVISLHILF